MKRILQWIGRRLSGAAVPLLILGALVAVLYLGGAPHEMEQAAGEIWTCSMHPQVRMDTPGRCPICGMTLIPISELKSEQQRVTERAGLETEPAVYRELFKEIRTVGKLDYNERRVKYLTARIDGRVDRVYADFTGITVKQNDHLVDIYSPALYSAQAELLAALQALEEAKGDRRFLDVSLDAARTKLRLLGILPEQLEEIEKSRQVTSHLRIYAPIGGVVIEKNIREQQYVKEGDMLYRIAELDPIWLYLDIYEYDQAWIRYGQSVVVTVEAYPGQTFEGTIVFIDPFLNDQTRTVKVRVNLKNADHKLKAAMYASATIHVRLRPDGTPQPTGLEGKYICPMHPEVVRDDAGQCDICEMDLERVPDLFPPHPAVEPAESVESGGEPKQVLAIRKSAVLDTGRRRVVYRKQADDAFELVEVTVGPLAEAKDEAGKTATYYPVLAGLNEGDEVVVSGGFLLDSQRQIEGMPSLLYTEGRSAASLHAGHGGGTATPGSGTPPATGGTGGHQH